MKNKISFMLLLLNCTALLSCSSSSNNFSHVGNLNAGRGITIIGKDSSIDLSNAQVTTGGDINLCGERGVRTPSGGLTTRSGSINIQMGGKCAAMQQNSSLSRTVESIKRKTDRLEIRERGGFTTVTPKSPSATVRLK